MKHGHEMILKVLADAIDGGALSAIELEGRLPALGSMSIKMKLMELENNGDVSTNTLPNHPNHPWASMRTKKVFLITPQGLHALRLSSESGQV